MDGSVKFSLNPIMIPLLSAQLPSSPVTGYWVQNGYSKH